MISSTQKIWAAVFLLVAILIYYLEGILVNPYALWNASPLLISYYLISKGLQVNSKPVIIGFAAYTILSLCMLLFGHLAWYFDWQETKTGSSTSGLIFIFLPVYAVILGSTGFLFGWLAGKAIYREKTKSDMA